LDEFVEGENARVGFEVDAEALLVTVHLDED
jgi:hypothetical protein